VGSADSADSADSASDLLSDSSFGTLLGAHYSPFVGVTKMPGVKMVVIYPTPEDVAAFEKVYNEEHIPLAAQKLSGQTKLVASRIVGSPAGAAPFHRIAEVHFASMDALQACAASEGGQATIAHAVAISTGGPPIFLVAEEESFDF
jgi:uncharacterized protein (TIGR02118 family)